MATGIFANQIESFARNTGKSIDKASRGIAMELFGSIIMATPVNQNPLEQGGRARANWTASGVSPATSITDAVDEAGTATVDAMESVIKSASSFEEFTLANNLPYANVLEFGGYPNPPIAGSIVSKPGVKPIEYEQFSSGGYSKAAPAGMVRVNVARFEKIVEEEAAKVRN